MSRTKKDLKSSKGGYGENPKPPSRKMKPLAIDASIISGERTLLVSTENISQDGFEKGEHWHNAKAVKAIRKQIVAERQDEKSSARNKIKQQTKKEVIELNSDRNEFLEMDGLFFESDTHEWFHDKLSTQYAHKKSVLWGSGEQNDALENLVCFVVRAKDTGEYDRVIMDKTTNGIVFETKKLEAVSFFIDELKIAKRFK